MLTNSTDAISSVGSVECSKVIFPCIVYGLLYTRWINDAAQRLSINRDKFELFSNEANFLVLSCKFAFRLFCDPVVKVINKIFLGDWEISVSLIFYIIFKIFDPASYNAIHDEMIVRLISQI